MKLEHLQPMNRRMFADVLDGAISGEDDTKYRIAGLVLEKDPAAVTIEQVDAIEPVLVALRDVLLGEDVEEAPKKSASG